MVMRRRVKMNALFCRVQSVRPDHYGADGRVHSASAVSAGGLGPVLSRLPGGCALRPGGEEPDLCVLGSGGSEGWLGGFRARLFLVPARGARWLDPTGT
jgi:hypothetical protein